MVPTTIRMPDGMGVAILKSSGSNGSQHITVKNCTIILNKVNMLSKGIYSNNHTSSNEAQLTVNASSGTNSDLKIFETQSPTVTQGSI